MSSRTLRTPDPAGLVFGNWTVLRRLPHTSEFKFHWRCRCACGTEATLYAPNLKRGLSKSCGCLKAELLRSASRTHGQTYSAEYEIWCGMKKRCMNQHCKSFVNYGGRGITVCQRWINSFENFATDMGPRPSSTHQIDRIDNDRGYEPANCRWATPFQQASNKSSNHWIDTPYGRVTIAEAARRCGLPKHIVAGRVRLGWPIERALSEPVHQSQSTQ